MEDILKEVEEKFTRYAKVDTQSDENATSYPSTAKQLVLARILARECAEMGLADSKMDEYGYVTATLPANVSTSSHIIGFIAHMDTSPSSSGKGVQPKVTRNYDGGDIAIDTDTILSPDEFPELKQYSGQDIITASGGTLLGADDKAGIAEILTAMEYLLSHPEIKHGKIRVGFTPDEEVGRGVEHFDVEGFGVDFGYTIDGGAVGELEAENFNAALGIFDIVGKSVHPGSAKGIMRNAAIIAAQMVESFPSDETPATTEGYEGFYHISDINADVEHAKIVCIIRDFTKDGFEARKHFVRDLTEKFNDQYDDCVTLTLKDQYYNMAEPLKDKQEIVDLAFDAMVEAGIDAKRTAIRGGTDGAMLCYKGLPCPNIFTGGHNFHGHYEYIPIQSMGKAVETIINISRIER
jgi:tripeptide aminopeptidase